MGLASSRTPYFAQLLQWKYFGLAKKSSLCIIIRGKKSRHNMEKTEAFISSKSFESAKAYVQSELFQKLGGVGIISSMFPPKTTANTNNKFGMWRMLSKGKSISVDIEQDTASAVKVTISSSLRLMKPVHIIAAILTCGIAAPFIALALFIKHSSWANQFQASVNLIKSDLNQAL